MSGMRWPRCSRCGSPSWASASRRTTLTSTSSSRTTRLARRTPCSSTPVRRGWPTLQFDKGQAQNGMNFGQNKGPDATAQQAVQAEMEAADLLTGNPNARLAAYNKIEQELVNFVAWFPMEQQEQNFLIKPCVQGLVLNAFGIIPPDDWNKIYISTDTPCAK